MRNWLLGVVIVVRGAVAAQTVDWRVEEVLRFSEAPPDIAFAQIRDVAVDREGRIYVLDGMNSEIYVFAPDGRHVRTIGRRGAGPGELSAQVQHLTIAGETLAVTDMGNQRITRFALDGRHIGEFPARFTDGMVMGLAGLPDGRLLVQREPLPLPPNAPATMRSPLDRPTLFVLDTAGAVQDTVVRFAQRTLVEMTANGMRMHFPDAMPVWMVDHRGRVLVGQTDRYALSWWDGARLGAPWGRAIPRQPMTARFRERTQRFQDSLMEAMASERGMPRIRQDIVFPDSFPVIGQVLPGPFGTVLVGRARGSVDDAPADTGGWRTDVFDADGRFLGVWELPAGFRCVMAAGDRLYGIALDEMELPYLVVYRVTR